MDYRWHHVRRELPERRLDTHQVILVDLISISNTNSRQGVSWSLLALLGLSKYSHPHPTPSPSRATGLYHSSRSENLTFQFNFLLTHLSDLPTTTPPQSPSRATGLYHSCRSENLTFQFSFLGLPWRVMTPRLQTPCARCGFIPLVPQ